MITTITRTELLSIAYTEASKTTRKVTPVGLAHAANVVALNLRDEWIHQQSAIILDRIGNQAVKLWDCVFNRLYNLDQSYLCTFDDADIDEPETGPQIIAHAIGVIRWYRLMHAGKVDPVLFVDEQSAADYLAGTQDLPPSKEGQLSFLDI